MCGVAEGLEDGSMRTLKAVRSVNKLVSRDPIAALQPRSEVNLDYCHDHTNFEAILRVGTAMPAIVIEDVEELLIDIRCSSEGLFLRFASIEYANAARDAWRAPVLVAFTSHLGCNAEGERIPYLITRKIFDLDTVKLVATPVSWAKISTFLYIDFKTTEAGLAKRDGTKDVNWSFKDKELVSLFGITQTCKDCSGSGSFSIKAGTLNLTAHFKDVVNGVLQVTSDIGSVEKVIATGAKSVAGDITSTVVPIATKAATAIASAGGDIKSVADGVGDKLKHLFRRSPDKRSSAADIFKPVANSMNLVIEIGSLQSTFEFETKIESPSTFSFPLLGSVGEGLPGWEIPSVARVGPAINPALVFDFHVTKPITFDYGFTMGLPAPAILDIDFLDPLKSSATGFDAFNITKIPLTIHDDGGGRLEFAIAFRPQIEMGIQALTLDVDPMVIFVDLPKINGTMEKLENVDDKCSTVSNGADHLYYQHSMEMGVGIGGNINLLVINASPQMTLASKTKMYSYSTCISYGAKSTDHTTTDYHISSPVIGTGQMVTGASAAMPTGNGPANASTVSGMHGIYQNHTATNTSGTGAVKKRTASIHPRDFGMEVSDEFNYQAMTTPTATQTAG